MKVLQLVKKFPYPLKDGEALAVNFLSRSLVMQGCTMDLLAINTNKHFFDPERCDEVLTHYRQKWCVHINTDITISGAFLNLFSSESYHISRFKSRHFETKLIDILSKNHYDIILMESIFVGPYMKTIRSHSRAQVVLRAHNLEYKIWQRVSHQTKNIFKKVYLKYLSEKLERYEIGILKEFDGLVPISPVDAIWFNKLGYTGRSFTFPISVFPEDFDYKRPNFHDSPYSISFIGSLDWMPNQEGLLWFVKEVWPKILSQQPKATLWIAGRHIPDFIYGLSDATVRVVGEVASSADFLHSHPITIVPLFSGSGMRAKIIEAMALGPLIVSTSLGAEGIDIMDGVHLKIANTKETFAQAVIELMDKGSSSTDMSLNARHLIEDVYNAKALGRSLQSWLDEL